MGSKTQKETTKESKAALPEYQRMFSRILGRASPLVDEEFEAYDGERVAGLDDAEMRAISSLEDGFGVGQNFDDAREMARRGAGAVAGGQPMLSDDLMGSLGMESGQWLRDSTAEGPQYSREALRQYTDPFLDDVLGTTLDWMGRANAQEQQQLTGNAIAKGAWGSDRAGLAKADLARNQGDIRAKTIADLSSRAFMNAQDQFSQAAQRDAQRRERLRAAATTGFDVFGNEAGRRIGVMTGDRDRALAGARTLADLASTDQSLGMQRINALLDAGKTRRGVAQARADADYDTFQKRKEFTRKNLDWLAGLSSGLSGAAGGTSESVKTTPGPNLLSQIAGGALTAAKVGSGMGWFKRGGVVKPMRYADGGQVLIEDGGIVEGDGWSNGFEAPPPMARTRDDILNELRGSLDQPSAFEQYVEDKAPLVKKMQDNREQRLSKQDHLLNNLEQSNAVVAKLLAEREAARRARTGLNALIHRAVATITDEGARDLSPLIKRLRERQAQERQAGPTLPGMANMPMADGGVIAPITVTPNVFQRRADATAKRARDFDDWDTIVGLLDGKPMGIGMADGGVFDDAEDQYDPLMDDELLPPLPAAAPKAQMQVAPDMAGKPQAPKKLGFYDRMIESDDLPLLMMGLNMMAGQSPHALTNIANGIMAGHQQTQQLRGAKAKAKNDDATAQARLLAAEAARENAETQGQYRQGMLTARQREADARAERDRSQIDLGNRRLSYDMESGNRRLSNDDARTSAYVKSLSDAARAKAAELERAGRKEEADSIRTQALTLEALGNASSTARVDDAKTTGALGDAIKNLTGRLAKTSAPKPPAPQPAPAPKAGPRRVNTAAEAQALPLGTQFIGPDGKLRVRQ
jgi:hypothetical protein